jgi:hypothetical protein
MRRNPPYGLILGVPADVNTKFVYGSGVGALNTSVRRYQKNRAAFNCCNKTTNNEGLGYMGMSIVGNNIHSLGEIGDSSTNGYMGISFEEEPLNLNTNGYMGITIM